MVLNLPMASFNDFIKDLAALLTLIQQSTQNIFLPISLSHSPIERDQFIVVLRKHEDVKQYQLASFFTRDIRQLSSKFVTKTIALGANFKADIFSIKFNKQLLDWN